MKIDNKREPLSPYTGHNLDHIAFPIGGMGAGMFALQGTGSLGSFSLKNKPDINNDPNIFAAIHIKGAGDTHIIEGQVPKFKIFSGTANTDNWHGMGRKKNYGFPRFKQCSFSSRFPFANIELKDDILPLDITVEGFSPFFPGNSFDASLPFGAIEYTFINRSEQIQESVFYFNSYNFVKTSDKAQVIPIQNGFQFYQPQTEEHPESQLWFDVFTDWQAQVNTAWYRGIWGDSLTMLSNDMNEGKSENKVFPDNTQSNGATLSVPFVLRPNESRTIRIFITWYAPQSNLRFGHEFEDKPEDIKPTYKPWYSAKFANIAQLDDYVMNNYRRLYDESKAFSNCFFASTLPLEILEAVSANLSILKSPTVLRQTDGRLWGWEGCRNTEGSCAGSCTHVWNYAQAICHLFPDLERGLRQTEYFNSQNDMGHQDFRASLPIGNSGHMNHAASDGQLGGIIKVYREWRISGDIDWLKEFWVKVKQSLEYCIKTWDPHQKGVLKEMHHNTYDIEFWGADIMCTSFYLGALMAAAKMAAALKDDVAERYIGLYEKGKKYAETLLYNGEFFVQELQYDDLVVRPKPESDQPEEIEHFQKEGPKYQYGSGCISDGVIGAWLSSLCGLGDILDRNKTVSHLKSIYNYNFKKSLLNHTNPQRPGFALGDEGGLLLCSWPYGGKPSIPFVYSDEVWTGIEYEVASYLISIGLVDEGLEIVRTCRNRYDGTVRNPFNEYECGHWYARAMSSYALLQSYTGVFYDAVTKTLYIKPVVKGDFQSFFSCASGYGLVGVKDGKPYAEAKNGSFHIEHMVYDI